MFISTCSSSFFGSSDIDFHHFISLITHIEATASLLPRFGNCLSLQIATGDWVLIFNSVGVVMQLRYGVFKYTHWSWIESWWKCWFQTGCASFQHNTIALVPQLGGELDYPCTSRLIPLNKVLSDSNQCAIIKWNHKYKIYCSAIHEWGSPWDIYVYIYEELI